jgi:hypothetical protein
MAGLIRLEKHISAKCRYHYLVFVELPTRGAQISGEQPVGFGRENVRFASLLHYNVSQMTSAKTDKLAQRLSRSQGAQI